MGERVQKFYDAILVLTQNTEAFVLTLWASISVIVLVLFGFFTLWKTLMWLKDKPALKDIRDELIRLVVAGAIILVNVGLPIGLIALIPGAGNVVRDFFSILFS